jgi:hypothetical protein
MKTTTRQLFNDINQVNLWIDKNLKRNQTYQLVNRFRSMVLLIVTTTEPTDPYRQTFYR